MDHNIIILQQPVDATTDEFIITIDGITLDFANTGSLTPNNRIYAKEDKPRFQNFSFELLVLAPRRSIDNTLNTQIMLPVNGPLIAYNTIGPRLLGLDTELIPESAAIPPEECYTVTLVRDLNCNFPTHTVNFKLGNRFASPPNQWDIIDSVILEIFFTEVVHFDYKNIWNNAGAIKQGACCFPGSQTLVDIRGQTLTLDTVNPFTKLLDPDSNIVDITHLIRFKSQTNNFISIPPHSLGLNCPNREILVLKGHPLLLSKETPEILAEELIGHANIRIVGLSHQEYIYTLVTPRRTFVNMNGIFVGTWSEAAWDNYTANTMTLRTWEFVW